MKRHDFDVKLKELAGLKSVKYTHEIWNKLASALFELLSNLPQGESIKFGKFGKFVVCERAARRIRNPKTGGIMELPKCKTVKFKLTEHMKEAVKNSENTENK